MYKMVLFQYFLRYQLSKYRNKKNVSLNYDNQVSNYVYIQFKIQ